MGLSGTPSGGGFTLQLQQEPQTCPSPSPHTDSNNNNNSSNNNNVYQIWIVHSLPHSAAQNEQNRSLSFKVQKKVQMSKSPNVQKSKSVPEQHVCVPSLTC